MCGAGIYGVPFQGWRHGPGHDKGKFAQTIAWVYDFCFDRFQKTQRERLADHARESMRLAEQWHDFDQAQVSSAVASGTIALGRSPVS